MTLKQLFLVFMGLSAGGVIAAGIFSFLAMIGVIPRLVGATGTKSHIMLYETMMVAGGIWGNLIDLYQIRLVLPGVFVLAVFGLSAGIFVGSLVMSLAETLKVLPVLGRRLGLIRGLPFVILSIALGKCIGAFIYFWNNFGGV